jgi:hypothetical protein
LALYYDPDRDPSTKADVLQAFVRALDHVPEWAMKTAFDRWERSGTRRPSPGEIVILADRELKPMLDEVAQRQKAHDEAEAERAARAKARVTPEAAERIMAQAGMTPDRLAVVKRFPMARSMDEAQAAQESRQGASEHWSATAAPDDPRWAMLRASRAASGLVPPQATRDSDHG